MVIKFLTLNLWQGGELFDKVLAFIEQQNADVIVLQEVYNGTDPALARQYRSMQVLKSELNYSYSDFVPDYRDFDRTGGKAQRGNAVLSKFPIIKREAMYFGEPYNETYRDVPGNYQNCPRDLQYVALDSPAGELNVFNIQGAWDLDGDRFGERRQQMSRAVISAVKGKSRVILAGDTNAKPTNQAIALIEEHLKNIFDPNPTTTFNMRRKDNPGYATAAVDMILTSSDITARNPVCHDVDISDHLPMTAELEIN